MRGRDGAERLLNGATIGLPADRAEWGSALRAELAAIDDSTARWRFARGAAMVGFKRGTGLHLALGLLSGILVIAISVAASRLQLANGEPVCFP